MYNVWEAATLARATRDIDLLAQQLENSVENITEIVKDICRISVDPDGLTFDVGSVVGVRIKEEADYEGVRVRFVGHLGTARVSMQLDIAFGDVVVPSGQPLEYPTLLDFPAPQLRGYSKESTVAEKFEAMVKLGDLNSRMKDFFDIWTSSHQFDFDGALLARALKETFSNRRTGVPASPAPFTPAFAKDPTRAAQWRAFRRRNRLTNAPEDLEEVVRHIASFLGPVAQAIAIDQPFEGRWEADGAWMK